MIQVWKIYHGEKIKPKQVRDTIRSKLSTETRALLSVMNNPPSDTQD